MHQAQTFLRLGALLSYAAGIAAQTYTLEDDYNASNFFDEFTFFTAADPTNGYVVYESAAVANSTGLAGISNGAVYMGVDYTTVNPSGGRPSVRVSSNKAYNHGLFIADLAHMPGSDCGVWPAFWTVGGNWPANGEIDIIEGVNQDTTDISTLHTSEGCSMSSTGSASGATLTAADCGAGGGYDGCGITSTNTENYGSGFNAIGGGVYAMQWTSSVISVYFFPRSSIPSDITSGSPDPSTWGSPQAEFTGNSCDIDSHFVSHNIVFDTTFCGDWAGSVWTEGSCASAADTCDDYVAANPSAFTDAYWMINSLKVYQESSSTKRAARPMAFMA
jgi:hypothetical protein